MAAASRSQNYADILRSPDPFITSLMLAVLGTVLCLLVGLPLAYYIATRGRQPQGPVHHPARHPVLDELPDPDLRLDPDPRTRRASPASSADATGNRTFRILGTEAGVLIGLVYGYLPLMVFPLYVTLERIDRTLVEASKDLGAGRLATFRQITLPIALPGLITGSILVFIPMMGEYVIPEILGYGRVFTDRATRWCCASSTRATGRPARRRPSALILVMLISVTFYVWFTNRGRQVRDVSVL